MFLAVALSSHDGQDALAVVLFAVIGWGDYLDGFAARLTGQYSRMGALLDPIVDRLLVISGMAVAWHFHLLPALGIRRGDRPRAVHARLSAGTDCRGAWS